ncbi:MAG TPA: hypothetical protein VKQ34_03665 [Candidatus Saccharimonadales bacterium]|nr:hypothetical protein [Candidatus Saccharimonadales bacterium]
MSHELNVALVAGGAQSSKSSISEAMAAYAEHCGLRVVYGDAGKHYRRLTTLTRDQFPGAGAELPPEDELADAISVVLKSHEADDEERDWGDLHTPGINAWVSHVANRHPVKADALAWFERTGDRALDRESDLLVINGRQPRQVLASWLARTGLVPVVELWTQCDPTEAAHRSFKGRPYTEEEFDSARDKIVVRRVADTQHTEYAVRRPRPLVPYRTHDLSDVGLRWAASLAVDLSWLTTGNEGALPHSIGIDTTKIPYERMVAATGFILDAALSRAPVPVAGQG